MAGNISNTNIWDPADRDRQTDVRGMFEEMVGWAVEAGADMIIGETFYYAGEALAALEVAKSTGLPAALTIAWMASGPASYSARAPNHSHFHSKLAPDV